MTQLYVPAKACPSVNDTEGCFFVVQELMLNHETKLCMTALKEIYQEWEKAEEEKQVSIRLTSGGPV